MKLSLLLPNAIVPINAETTGELVREVMRLRKGIQDYLDGNYVSPRDGRAVSPQQKCPHGMFYWDACENCIDEHFKGLLAPLKPEYGSEKSQRGVASGAP